MGLTRLSATQAARPEAFPKYPWLPYVAPFATFITFLMLDRIVPVSIEILYPARLLVVSAVLVVFSRSVLDFRVSNWIGTVLLGVAVFAIWVGPDLLWPGYRGHWLLTNSITGHVQSSIPQGVRSNVWFIVFRSMGCVLIVPILEELFWRGWLARWLIDGHDFRRVSLGAYTAASFWIGSVMFASEHGPFWDVGLVAGIAYNGWMCRTKSLGDCMLAHAVTNGCLSVYVLMADQWQYWM